MWLVRHAVTRGDLADAHWAALEPLLQKVERSGRPPKHSKRGLITWDVSVDSTIARRVSARGWGP